MCLQRYQVCESASPRDVYFGAAFVKAFCHGEVLEGEVGLAGFEALESFEEVFVGPLLFLRLSNSASYRKLAFSSPEKALLTNPVDCWSRGSPLRRDELLCTGGGIVPGWRSPISIAPGTRLRSFHTFSISSNLSWTLLPDLW